MPVATRGQHISTRSGKVVAPAEELDDAHVVHKSPVRKARRRSTAARAAAASDDQEDDDTHEEEPSAAFATASSPPSASPFHYEFGGPVGALASVILLPLVVLGLYYACGRDYCYSFPESPIRILEKLPRSVWEVVTPAGCLIFLGWLLFQAVLELLLPGEIVEGTLLPDGSRLRYKINGHLCFWASLLILGHGVPQFDAATGELTGLGAAPLARLYDHYAEIAAAACLFSLVAAAALYLASLRRPAPLLAAPGSSGSPIYDFWMGRELNPRLGPIDLKFFCELRPGIIGWTVLNLGMAAKQHEMTGSVSAPMMAVVFCQAMYAWDALYHERSILTTMDITTDGFGFMLVFGDLAWVPFIYSAQARYLVDYESTGLLFAGPQGQLRGVAVVLALHFLGYAIFRGANGQKDAFRRNPAAPAVSHLRWMPTARGTKLLTSGWWGMARKINYTGDWLMGLSWCLAAGFGHVTPYFYASYFAVLLVHRALRDDHICREKYGADWDRYKAAVPAMFVPGVI